MKSNHDPISNCLRKTVLVSKSTPMKMGAFDTPLV